MKNIFSKKKLLFPFLFISIFTSNIYADPVGNDININISEGEQYIFNINEFSLSDGSTVSQVRENYTNPTYGKVYIDENLNNIIDAGEEINPNNGYFNSSDRLTSISEGKLKYKSLSGSAGNTDGFGFQLIPSDSSFVTGNWINVYIAETPNNLPTITSSEITQINDNETYNYTFVANDIDTDDNLTLSAITVPVWLNFNTQSGELSGIPSNSDVGTHNVVLNVNDGTDDVNQTFTITVNNINNTPMGELTIDAEQFAQGITVTANTNSITDKDGLGEFNYQWKSGNTNVGINSSTYKIKTSDIGNSLTVTVSYSDDSGFTNSISSEPSIEVINTNDLPTGSLVIEGVLKENETLSADASSIADNDGLGSFYYQWLRDGEIIDNALSANYTLTKEDIGSRISVVVSYEDSFGTNETISSSSTEIIQPLVNNSSFVSFDTNSSYIWNENIGWISLEKTKIFSDHLEGYMWSSEIGWIELNSKNTSTPFENTSNTNWGVNIDKTGKMSGYAWNDQIGWIEFHKENTNVSIDLKTGIFSGYAWNDQIGWINFEGDSFKTQASEIPNLTNNLIISQNWSLLSLPVDVVITYEEFPTKFKNANTIWKYSNASGWKAYGKDNYETLLNNKGINKITSISKGEGFWINSSMADSLYISGESYNILTSNLLTSASSGWHLLGTGSSISVSDIINTNSNISTIWSFSNNSWSLYSSDSLKIEGIDELTTISKGEGFWVYIP